MLRQEYSNRFGRLLPLARPGSVAWIYQGLAVTTMGAAILAGGQSRRMGTDKALIQVGPRGETALELVVDRVQAVCDQVVIVAPPERGYARFGLPIIDDRTRGQGPLGGIATALDVLEFEPCLVVACDLPLLRAEMIAWMASRPFPGDALVPRIPRDGRDDLRPQPLLALYRRQCLDVFRRRLARGDLRLIAALDDLAVSWIEPDEIRPIDPDFRSFMNLNEPADWDRAAKILKREKPGPPKA